jgi:hypothetical protein
VHALNGKQLSPFRHVRTAFTCLLAAVKYDLPDTQDTTIISLLLALFCLLLARRAMHVSYLTNVHENFPSVLMQRQLQLILWLTSFEGPQP